MDRVDWLTAARQRLQETVLTAQVEITGRVEHVADGIAQISGLPKAGLGEMLHFEGGQSGLALTLDRHRIGAVILDDASAIEAGSKVAATGNVVKVPVGKGLLGRVVDPLGRSLDSKEPITAEAYLPVERAAPTIIERDLVTEPVDTGILIIDALFALGRGQRELIIGDRATGKTSIAVDAIINQKNSDLVCVYVAIGQRATAVERVIEAIRKKGAAERCIFVVAGPSDSPGLQWIAPFAGMTMAEHFRDQGLNALIVLDDLTRHAATHRELALLTNEPPGREAYPGDIFYVHARLLERAAKLSPEIGGGSLTALPIAETDAGNLSAYIPTNLISITDGQVVLDTRLFAANQRPAVDVGLSVSRVGGKAQHPMLRRVAGRVRLDYAQFLELEMFTRFGGIADDRVTQRVVRGERIRALLSQPRFSTLRSVDEIALLIALADGVLDDLSVNLIENLREEVPDHLNSSIPDIVTAFANKETVGDAEFSALVAAVRDLLVILSAHHQQVSS
jgi:F-type H+-transporting ATPase subunit alpha